MHSTKKSNLYEAELTQLQEDSRWRFLRTWQAAGGVFEHEDGKYLNFSSNDYLDLSRSPALPSQVTKAMEAYGCGATASRLMSGNLSIHGQLEQALADLVGQETALVFPSGYQANVGVMTSLASSADTIYSDALNHASIVDGARLSRAKIQIYRHNDTSHLEALLEQAPIKGRRIIVTDSVFSMDGDLAPLRALAELAARFNAILVVDEAHAVGIWGEGGGVGQHLGILPDITVGTLGKALGSGGGFVACDTTYRDLLINRARSFIYSTGVSPMNAAAALGAIEAIRSGPGIGAELLARAQAFQGMLVARGIEVVVGETQIIPIMVGDDERVMALANTLLESRLIATGIRPPTVPEGTSRLRLSVTLAHDLAALDEAAELLARVVAP